MSSEINELDASEALEALQKGDFSAKEYAENVIKRNENYRNLNAIVALNPESFLREADLSDQRRMKGEAGPLEGLPLVLKDNINTSHLKTTGGTPALADFQPTEDAPCAKMLKSAGAILGAKAGMHELAFGITSNNAYSGAIKNPYIGEMIAGGSSGGVASAVAARIFPAGLGTDTGGSCRIPAALCGIIGFRPTTGRYNSSGVVPISNTRDTVGPMARKMDDICLLDNMLTTASRDQPDMADLSKLRIGVPHTVFYEDLEPEVAEITNGVLQQLNDAGVTLVDADFPDIWPYNEGFSFPVVFYEVMRHLPQYLADYAPHVTFEKLIEKIASPDVQGALQSQLGDEKMPLEAYHAALNEFRPAMREIYSTYMSRHKLDAILFPTTPLRARPIGQDETVSLNSVDQPTFPTYIRNTDLGSNLGVPGLTLPSGLAGGLPVGIEFDGISGGDEALLALGKAVEALLGPISAPQ
jgi:indoleacetamide hydrolase